MTAQYSKSAPAGTKLRLAVQLADTVSGAHLWAETYERAFTPESLFEVQDDLVPRIVATVADQYGVLPRSMSEVLRNKSEDALTPQEAVLRTFSYFSRIDREEHAVVRDILERSVREAPDHADSWALLASRSCTVRPTSGNGCCRSEVGRKSCQNRCNEPYVGRKTSAYKR